MTINQVPWVCQHSFVLDYLDDSSLVLDCGANRGTFSSWIARHVGCSIHAFEPDPRLNAAFPSIPRCELHEQAVSHRVETLRLHLGEQRCSSLYYSEGAGQAHAEVQTVTLPLFCEQHAIDRIDLLKLDIEGAEVPILLETAPEFLQRVVAQATVEFHDHKDPGVIPDIRRIFDRMRGLGFYCISFSHFTYGDVLFINRSLIALGLIDPAALQTLKYARGVGRYVRRKARRRRADAGVPVGHRG